MYIYPVWSALKYSMQPESTKPDYGQLINKFTWGDCTFLGQIFIKTKQTKAILYIRAVIKSHHLQHLHVLQRNVID